MRPAVGSKLFNVPGDFIKVFDRALAAAGIAKRDERDRGMDIHAPRHTFGTHLSKAGVTPRVAMAGGGKIETRNPRNRFLGLRRKSQTVRKKDATWRLVSPGGVL
jgi:hypothetical protein